MAVSRRNLKRSEKPQQNIEKFRVTTQQNFDELWKDMGLHREITHPAKHPKWGRKERKTWKILVKKSMKKY